MLFAGLGSVRMVKNCDLGPENAALGLGQHFQALGHSFSPYGPPSRQITYIYLKLRYNVEYGLISSRAKFKRNSSSGFEFSLNLRILGAILIKSKPTTIPVEIQAIVSESQPQRFFWNFHSR